MDLLDPKSWDRSIYIDGFTDGGGGDYAVVEPATGAELGRLGRATADDVDRAAQRARDAQREWAAAPYSERAAVLRRAADMFDRHADEIRSGSCARPAASSPRATSSWR